MKIENCIIVGSAVVAALIVATGWVVTGYQNRRKDVAEKRLEYRLKALESFLPVFFRIHKERAIGPTLVPELSGTRSNFLLYGYQDEKHAMEKFVSSIEAADLSGTKTATQELIDLTVKRIRNELEICC